MFTATQHPPVIGTSEERWCATLGKRTAQCTWRRKHGFNVPSPSDWRHAALDNVSPYDQWWELSTLGAETDATAELARMRRQRWWWLLGGAAAGFAVGGLIYQHVGS